MSIDVDVVARLRALNSGVVSDVLDECGYPHQALSSAIRPLRPDMRLAGAAVCFGGDTIGAEGSSQGAVSTYDMDRHIAHGAVVVIATRAHEVSAVVGGLMSLSFAKLGCAGVVTDGGVRDATEIAELPLPTFSRYVTPMRSNARWQLTDAGVPVALPGQEARSVTVTPGDYLIGDEDGVIVIPSAIAVQVIEWAEELVRIEARIVQALEAGMPREQAFAANPRFRHIGRLR